MYRYRDSRPHAVGGVARFISTLTSDLELNRQAPAAVSDFQSAELGSPSAPSTWVRLGMALLVASSFSHGNVPSHGDGDDHDGHHPESLLWYYTPSPGQLARSESESVTRAAAADQPGPACAGVSWWPRH